MTLRGALRAATIALLATAAGGAMPARAQDIFCEPGDLEVRDLEFRGNQAISDDDLELRVTTTASSWARRTLRLRFLGVKRCLSRPELARDVQLLRTYYRDRGFYSAQVDTIVAPIGRDAVRVIFQISEGSPLRLASYTVTGLEGIRDSADVMRRLRLKVGDPFDILVFGADMDTIVRRLRNVGYYHAETIPGYDWDTAGVAEADAFITVVPGKQARFGEPVLEVFPVTDGRRQEIADPIVRRLLGIAPGQLYSDDAIVQAQRNLFQLGAYQHVEVAPLPSLQTQGDTVVILRVSLTEDYIRQVDSELGWATLDCGRIRLQYTDKNFLKTARRLELTGQASKIGFGEPLQTSSTRDVCTLGGKSPLKSDRFSDTLHYFTGFAVRQPRLLGTLWVPTLSVYSERRGEYKAYSRSTKIGADLSATREVGDRMPLRVAYNFEYGQTQADAPALCALFNTCDQPSRDQIQKLAPLGVATAALARVRTDNLITPTRGTMMRAEVRTSASRFLGSEYSLFFNKGTADVAWYRKLGWQNVLAVRLRGGLVLGRRFNLTDSTGVIPPQERLYAGGPTSVRGFQQNELGSTVYIAKNGEVRVDTTVVAPGDTTFQFALLADNERPGIDIDSVPDRAVPLGGDALFVANFEYRIRDPFFRPGLLQYTLFLDGGDAWTRVDRPAKLKWTPGFGVRALTPVGPVQVNVGWNRYNREDGQLYYNPDVTLLACASPASTPLVYTRNPANGQLETTGTCPRYTPPTRQRWWQELTFTFSIGPDF